MRTHPAGSAGISRGGSPGGAREQAGAEAGRARKEQAAARAAGEAGQR